MLFRPLVVLLRFYLLLVAIFTAGRVLLLFLYSSRIADRDASIIDLMITGLRLDTVVISVFLVLPVLLLCLSPRVLARPIGNILSIYFLVVLLLSIFVEVSTYPFIEEFDNRPNEIFINYLVYPKEVFSTVFKTQKLSLLLAAVLMLMLGVYYWKNYRPAVFQNFEVPLWKRLILLVPIFLLVFAGARGSLEHRPANPSDAIISNNRLFNEITKNSLHNVLYAYYSQKRHDGDSDRYGNMSVPEADSRVTKILNLDGTNVDHPTLRTVLSRFKADKPKNLVIFLQESLGWQFVAATGGEEGITPNINSLAKEGILFSNLYASGIRSVRGIASLVAGFLPAPGEGVIKRNKAQTGFFTIAELLAPLGYKTSFFYGGESRFDNMKSWFSGNGFDEIYDQPTFTDAKYTGTWGVSDGDMVVKADQKFQQWSRSNQPFASVIYSTSNHTPFDFPEGDIELIEGLPVKSEKNAIKYADYAVGKFVGLARQNGYFDDTVIVVVADHNIRVRGDTLLPINMFQIPGIIVGGGIEPQVISKRASQPDVLATALDLMGLDLVYPIFGQSLFSESHRSVSFMKFNEYYGLRVEDKVAIIHPDTPAKTYSVSDDEQTLVQIDSDTELEKDALALVVTLNSMYTDKRYTSNPAGRFRTSGAKP